LPQHQRLSGRPQSLGTVDLFADPSSLHPNALHEHNESFPMRRYQPVRIVQPALFDRGTAQTSGSERRSAITADKGIETKLWGGTFNVQPGAKTGIHHHGEQETIAYVLEGDCLVRWGESGEYCAAAHAGDFIHVPAWLPHMEINASEDHHFAWVVVRSTAKPIVINLPDSYWQRQLDVSPFMANTGELAAEN
jgi:uncharacterized RmlC-like cupin family protein